MSSKSSTAVGSAERIRARLNPPPPQPRPQPIVQTPEVAAAEALKKSTAKKSTWRYAIVGLVCVVAGITVSELRELWTESTAINARAKELSDSVPDAQIPRQDAIESPVHTQQQQNSPEPEPSSVIAKAAQISSPKLSLEAAKMIAGLENRKLTLLTQKGALEAKILMLQTRQIEKTQQAATSTVFVQPQQKD